MTSFLISLGDDAASHPGALLKMLLPLAKRGINLSKIESRPSKKRPWDYFFFIDVTGPLRRPGHARGGQAAARLLPDGEMARQLPGGGLRRMRCALRQARDRTKRTGRARPLGAPLRSVSNGEHELVDFATDRHHQPQRLAALDVLGVKLDGPAREFSWRDSTSPKEPAGRVRFTVTPKSNLPNLTHRI